MDVSELQFAGYYVYHITSKSPQQRTDLNSANTNPNDTKPVLREANTFARSVREIILEIRSFFLFSF